MAAAGGHGQRLAALDGLRGMSVLIVVVFHYAMGYAAPPPGHVLATEVVWDGFAAVSVFFVLSGFVLSHGLLQPGGGSSLHVGSFYIARGIRILGPYAAAFLLGVFCVHYLFPVLTTQTEWRSSLFLDTWVRASSLSGTELVREGVLVEPSLGYRVMIQAWTLSIELYLSLLFPLLIVLLRRAQWLFVAIVLMLPFYHRLPVHPYPMLAIGVLHFMLGMLLARHHAGLARILRATRWRWLFFFVGFLLLTVRHSINMPLRVFHPFGYELWNIAAFGAVVIVCAALVSAPFGRVLCLPFINWLGRISYSVYLLHIAVLYLLVPWAMQAAAALGGQEWAIWLAGLAATLGFSLGLAQLFYWMVERPCTRLARDVIKARRQAPVVTGAIP